VTWSGVTDHRDYPGQHARDLYRARDTGFERVDDDGGTDLKLARKRQMALNAVGAAAAGTEGDVFQ